MDMKKETTGNIQRYEKEELLKADRYRQKADLIEALLEPDTGYTIKEVDAVIEKFLKGKVK